MWVLALIAFAIAAFLALATISGVTLTMIIGIIAIGLCFLALEVGKWTPPWPRR